MRRAEDPFLFGAVAHLEKDIASAFVASALLPDLGWLKSGHQDFECASPVHLFADDLFDFAKGSEAEREKSVEAAGQFADQTCPQKELVRKNLRIGGRFLQGRNQIL